MMTFIGAGKIYYWDIDKGKEVADYRGVNSASFYKIEIETNRQKESLKKWCELYEKHPVYEDYKRMASEKVLVKL
ncbi:MAG: hypothetical protein KAW92_12605 [Candidatus Cloacimonetes bacterium]|nr:hypothetical protein [Candidatus Cloacimonadota bacterium]